MAQINFKGKTFVQNHHLTVKYHELIPQKAKSLTNKISLHDNLIIHGDNIKALKALLPTYGGKIKCIYIDPPYNTGNEKWAYNDNVNSPMMQEWLGKIVDKEDLTRHDKWLCMMMPRLKLLRELLSDDGVIFISIDDNEQHHLRSLMDDVFGEDNFIGNISVVNNLKGRNDKKNIAQIHEYVLIYSRIQNTELIGLPLTEEQKAAFKHKDEKGNKYDLRDLRKRGRPDRREDRPNMYYPLYYDKPSKSFSLERVRETDIEIYPKRGDGSDGRWRWGREKIGSNLNILHARYSKINDRWDIDHRVYLNQISGGQIPGEGDSDEEDQNFEERLSKTKSVWFGSELSTDIGRRELLELFTRINFDYPKSVSHIKRLVHMANCDGGVVLDSFAGSGTTAHAVLDLNKEDGGNRRFILVECEDYADEITAERARRVIKGYSDKEGTGGTFSYFELGKPIEMESILSGKNLPTYLELARYVFYTATGEEFNEKTVDEKRNFIGENEEYKIYLFYKPDLEYLKNTALTLDRAKNLGPYKTKKRLVFAPTKYLDQDQLDQYRIDFAQLPFEIYKLAS